MRIYLLSPQSGSHGAPPRGKPARNLGRSGGHCFWGGQKQAPNMSHSNILGTPSILQGTCSKNSSACPKGCPEGSQGGSGGGLLQWGGGPNLQLLLLVPTDFGHFLYWIRIFLLSIVGILIISLVLCVKVTYANSRENKLFDYEFRGPLVLLLVLANIQYFGLR